MFISAIPTISFILLLVWILLVVRHVSAMTRYGEPCYDDCTKRPNWLGKLSSYYTCRKAEMYYENIILGKFFKYLYVTTLQSKDIA